LTECQYLARFRTYNVRHGESKHYIAGFDLKHYILYGEVKKKKIPNLKIED